MFRNVLCRNIYHLTLSSSDVHDEQVRVVHTKMINVSPH